jgi:hypothetical protein
MKGRMLLLSLSVMLFLIGAYVVSAQEENWSLIGSWINRSYESSPLYPARLVFGNDGVVSQYQRLADKTPLRFKYVIDDSRTESGIHWLKVRQAWPGSPDDCRIIKLTEGGNTFESVGAVGDYPEKFETVSSSYYHETRQRE